MALRQAATRIDEEQYALFRDTTRSLGTTPSDALRMFIYAFNAHRGFPYEVRLESSDAEFLSSEEESTAFATRLAMRTMNDQI